MKKSTLGKIKGLLEYYQSSRGVGHTHMVKYGVENTDQEVAIMTNADIMRLSKRRLDKMPMVFSTDIEKEDVIVTSFETFEDDLKGKKVPLVLDNSAIYVILQLAILEIEALQDRIDKIKAM